MGLRTMLSNFSMFIFEDNQDNGEDYATNDILHFFWFKEFPVQELKFQLVQEINNINVKNTYSWYSYLYKWLEMRTYVSAIYKGVAVVKRTVGVGRQIIIKMNADFFKQDSPDGFENRALLTALRQSVRHVSEIGSSIWNNFSWNNNTEIWEI